MKYLILIAVILSSCSVTKPRSNRFCGIIADVKYTKNGRANVRPTVTRYWFRYPNQNIHIGDTVELCLKDRIEPSF